MRHPCPRPAVENCNALSHVLCPFPYPAFALVCFFASACCVAFLILQNPTPRCPIWLALLLTSLAVLLHLLQSQDFVTVEQYRQTHAESRQQERLVARSGLGARQQSGQQAKWSRAKGQRKNGLKLKIDQAGGFTLGQIRWTTGVLAQRSQAKLGSFGTGRWQLVEELALALLTRGASWMLLQEGGRRAARDEGDVPRAVTPSVAPASDRPPRSCTGQPSPRSRRAACCPAVGAGRAQSGSRELTGAQRAQQAGLHSKCEGHPLLTLARAGQVISFLEGQQG